MRYLIAAALVASLPATGSAQRVTLMTGWRFPSGPLGVEVPAGPLFGMDVKPLRWRWGAAGVELSHAPRRGASQGSRESTSQLGTVVLMGSLQKRSTPFAEVGLGYYRTTTGVDSEGGVYLRGGAGYQVMPWTRGPTLAGSLRYRLARRGSGPTSWMEWFNQRNGAEIVLAVRF